MSGDDVDLPTKSYAELLRKNADAAGLKKSDRTRLRLLASIAAQLTDGKEQAELRVADVAAGAGVSHGTFYLYFSDLKCAIENLISDFGAFLYQELAGARSSGVGMADRIREATLAYAKAFRANVGLMRCLFSLARENSAFRRSFQELSEGWNRRVASAIARQRDGQSSEDMLLPTAYALGGMVDDFLTQIYLREDPALSHLAGDDDAIADLLTDIWCFGAFGRSTLPRESGDTSTKA